MYIYRSPIGSMTIRYNHTQSRWLLCINDICYGAYHSAVAAADDVYCHATGCHEWDSLDCLVDGPTDISEWENL